MCPRSKLVVGAVVTLVLAASARVWVRNADWASENALLGRTLQQYPMNPMSIYGRAWLAQANKDHVVQHNHTAMSMYFSARAALASNCRYAPLARPILPSCSPHVAARTHSFADPLVALAEFAGQEGNPKKAMH